ncbi:hypothetical protein BKH19_09120 [Actinomyces oris]|nr:hypothetical protein BKH19_09120 [Actinomyces oris]
MLADAESLADLLHQHAVAVEVGNLVAFGVTEAALMLYQLADGCWLVLCGLRRDFWWVLCELMWSCRLI